MYVYICTDTPVYVCMYVYVYKYTYSSPPVFVSLIHAYTHLRAVFARKRPEEKYFGSYGEERESSEKSEAVTRQILSSEFPRREDFLSSITTRRGVFSSAHITRPPPPTRIDFYTHIPHTYTYIHPSRCDDSEKLACINARSRARVNREIITLRGANARAIRPFSACRFPFRASKERYKRDRR